MAELTSSNAIVLPHRNLRYSRWDFEDTSASALLDRLTTTGNPLESVLRAPLVRGLLTGLNEAFYVDSRLRDALVGSDPGSEHLFKKLIRGRDIGRWTASWHDQWHIVTRSSQNHRWPWSNALTEEEAEMMFEKTYPSVYNHLKDFKERLVARKDKGVYWWELRSCGYYEEFEKPKIVVQCIAYYSRFALDAEGHYSNNKVIIVPTDDHYILGILNSRVIWWIVNRTFQHMKDEGLNIDVQFLRRCQSQT